MIFCWLTRSQVEAIAASCPDASVQAAMAKHLRDADVFGEPAPRSVLYTDEGDGLHFAAVTYHHDRHADEAWQMLWDDIQRWAPTAQRSLLEDIA